MQPHRMEHIGVKVTDAERSIRFYTEVMGMALAGRRAFGSVELIFLELAGQQIELIAGAHDFTEANRPIDHIAFTVADLDAAKAHVADKLPGVTFDDLDLWDGMRCAFFAGPDGERLELFERRNQG